MNLLYSTQVSLMRSSWSDLFLLCLAQCREQISIPAILTASVSNLQNSLGQDMITLAKTNELATTLKSISLVLKRIEEFHLEPEEFAYLKLCCLFSPGEIHYERKIGLSDIFFPDESTEDRRRVTEPVVDCVLAAFERFYQKNQKDVGRLGKLLLLLSQVKNIKADLLEELFFPGMVGSVKIDSVIPYILTMGEGVGQGGRTRGDQGGADL